MREEVGSVLVLNAGNLLFKREFPKETKKAPYALRAELIVSSYNKMGCDGFNVGAYDLALGIDYLLLKEKEATFPFISANLTDKHGKPFFRTHRLIDFEGVKIGILGLIGDDLKQDRIPGGHKLFVQDPLETAERMVPELRERGAEFVVVLTDMMGRSVRKLALLDQPIDLIVSSDKRNQISLPVIYGDSFITHLDRGGKCVGRLEVEMASREDAQAASEAGKKHGKQVGANVFRNSFVQLRLSFPDDPVIGPMVSRFEKEVAALQKEVLASADRDEDGECGTSYVGVATCKECHPERYATWAETDHARAFATLEAKNKQYDEECLVCHALAFQCDEEPDMENVRKFANVQCESCHGPGDLHVASQGSHGTQPLNHPERVCMRCHTPERTEEIDFDVMAEQVCNE